MIEKYNSMSLKGKNIFWMVFIGVAGLVILSPFALTSNIGLGTGFLLGTIIEICCYLLLCLTSDVITKTVNGTSKTGSIALSSFGFFIRYFLYAAGLVPAALCTFVWKNNYLNIWTTFVAYLPMAIIVAVNTLIENKKNASKEG